MLLRVVVPLEGIVRVHVYPTYGRAHDVEEGACWCDPEVETVPNGNQVIVHREDN